MKFKISDQSVNSYGYIVLTSGIRHPEKVPCLLNHDMDKLPIGYFTNFEKEGNDFFGELVIDENEEKVNQKLTGGFLDSVSMGFMVKNITEIGGQIAVSECELKEVSLVSIPSNPNAKKLAIGELQTLSIKYEPKTEINKLNIMDKTELEGLKTLAENQKAMIVDLQKQITAISTEKETELSTLKAELKAINEANLKANAEAIVRNAIEAKKILPSQKEAYLKLAMADFNTTKDLLNSIEPYKSISSQLSAQAQTSQADARKDWTFEDWQKKDSKGLATLKAENLTAYNELLKTLNRA